MLALIAGQGALPEHLMNHTVERPVVASLERFPPDTVEPDMVFRIEQLGTFLAALKAKGVTEVCFAGSLSRRPIDPAEIDAATMPLVPRMMEALKSGDDAALRTVLAFFEEAGFAIRAPHEIAPDLLPQAGPLGAIDPTPETEGDILRAVEILRAMGAVDIGQACAVHRGQALAVEGQFGTDFMLAALANRPDGGGGVLVKAPKPTQDHRIDLPAIGPGTIASAKTAGLTGIVIEEGGVMVLERSATVSAADEAGLFIWVRSP